MKRTLLPTEHPLHLLFPIILINHNTPSFVLCLHMHSVLQLDLFVASTYRTVQSLLGPNPANAKKNVMSAFLLVHLVQFIIKSCSQTQYSTHSISTPMPWADSCVVYQMSPTLHLYLSLMAQLVKIWRSCFCPRNGSQP